MVQAPWAVIAWPPADPEAAGRVAAMAARLQAEGDWEAAVAVPGVRIWRRRPAPIPLETLPRDGGWVLGSRQARHGAVAPATCAVMAQRARDLCATSWGAWVAVLPDEAGGPPAILRDPSGALDTFAWRLDGSLEVAASAPADVPGWLRPPRLSLNWDRIAVYLAQPTAMAEALFDGVEAVAPGVLRSLGGDRVRRETLWTPAAFTGAARVDPQGAQAALVAAVDESCAGLVGRHGRVIVELSGGLDSAIVAGSLGATGMAPRVTQWLNRTVHRPEGDETACARSVTDRLGAALTSAVKPMAPLRPEDLAELGPAVWPAINGVDAGRDRDECERLAATGADAIVSGQGGDAVFYQMPTPWLAPEILALHGVGREGLAALAATARRMRAPVWALLWQARSPARHVLPSLASPLVTAPVRALAAGTVHPWVAAAAGLPPARQLQVRAIANAQIYRGDCRRRRQADLLYPLLAQPVVELCLGLPVADLAAGEQDRPLARAAFADRVPGAVLARRAKGSLSAWYAQLAAISADGLRSWLLDGCLADAGLLDRAEVDRALTVEALIWRPAANELFCAAAVEAWVRYWQGRAPDSAQACRG